MSRSYTAAELVSLLEQIATQIEAEQRVGFRTKDAIRHLVSAIVEALK